MSDTPITDSLYENGNTTGEDLDNLCRKLEIENTMLKNLIEKFISDSETPLEEE